MYRVYAQDPQARINLGIRRRLAPLLGNDRRRIELMNGLLFSLPGTPVLYYGDEIGMGDNVYLGDRNGVRTPMQWSGDRNAGFSRGQSAAALPAGDHRSRVPLRGDQRRDAAEQPALAAVVDEAADRAAQAIPGVRPRHARVPAPDNRKVLAFVRRYERRARSWSSPTCRASRSPRSSTFGESTGMTPIEMFGRVEFPTDRRAAVLPDPRPALLLLVQPRTAAERGGGPGRRAGGRGVGRAAGSGHRWRRCAGTRSSVDGLPPRWSMRCRRGCAIAAGIAARRVTSRAPPFATW